MEHQRQTGTRYPRVIVSHHFVINTICSHWTEFLAASHDCFLTLTIHPSVYCHLPDTLCALLCAEGLLDARITRVGVAEAAYSWENHIWTV